MYTLSKNFVYRECIFPYNILKDIDLEDSTALLNNPIFKEILTVANPKMFLDSSQIKKTSSLRNYLKRMVLRPTPYGLFSTVGLGELSNTTNSYQTCNYYKKATIDNGWLLCFLHSVEKSPRFLPKVQVRWNPLVISTPSHYKINWISQWGTMHEYGKKISIKRTPLLDKIYTLTHKKYASVNDIITDLLKLNNAFDDNKLLNYISTLLESEILISNLRPSIVNENILENTIEKIKSIDSDNIIYKELVEIHQLLNQYNNTKLGYGLNIYLSIINKLEKLYFLPNKDYIKVDLVSDPINEYLPTSDICNIEDLANFLVEISPRDIRKNINLLEYTKAFLEKYGTSIEVPIKELLDEQLGLGSPFDIRYSNTNNDITSSEFHKLKHFLAYKAALALEKKIDIELTDEDIPVIYGNDRTPITSPQQLELFVTKNTNNTKNVNYCIVHGTGDDLKGKSIGRFIQYFQSSAIDYMDASSKVELVEFPSNGRCINVGNVFHKHSDTLYLNTFACSQDPAKSIDINDIFVGVKKINGTYKIYFHNVAQNTIVNFTSSSMLNPSSQDIYSDLGMFLLKCSSELFINPFGLHRAIESLNDIPHLPSIVYKGFKISSERWILPKASRTNHETLMKWVEQWNIPNKVLVHEADQCTLIDFNNYSDCNWLIKKIADYIYLSTFENIQNESPIREYVFCFEEKSNNYPITLGNPKKRALNASTCALPYFDNSWLYLQLTGIQGTEDYLLYQNLYSFVEKALSLGILEDFHFVRYYENFSKSLRIRFKFHNNNFSYGLMLVKDWCNNLLHTFVNEISFHLYEPEIERYGGILEFPLCEKAFSQDSYYILNLASTHSISKKADSLLILHSLFTYLISLGIKFETIYNYILKNFNHTQYRKEFRTLVPNKKILLNEFSCYMDNTINSDNGNMFSDAIAKSFSAFPPTSSAIITDEEAIMSLIHMHFNRFGVTVIKEKELMYIFRHVLADLYKTRKNGNNQ